MGRGQMIEDPGDELVDIPAGDLALGVWGARRTSAVEDFAGGLIERQAPEHQGAADRVAAEARGGVAVGGADVAVHREFMCCSK